MAVQFAKLLGLQSPTSTSPATGSARAKSLASGSAITQLADTLSRQSPAHGDAIVTTTLSALSALAKKPGAASKPYDNVHLLRAVYAPGDTVRGVLHGAQLGASSAVTDSRGRVHVYALAYIG